MSKPMTESRLAEYDKLNENLISDYINEQNAPINCLHFRDVIAEVRRLRKAIEDGPHTELCLNYNDGCFIHDPRYNCKCIWKRNALEGK